ncbi:hypothetical protein ACFRKE_01760 [Kitasatospora indigofera]|uniref:hypothetical protein n=1 Tax=Kitasatospora indigofera TaxID=67307 RepID=UPI0036AB849E
MWDCVTEAWTAESAVHTDRVEAVAISPDGNWIASCGRDGRLGVWERASGSATAFVRTDSSLTCCSWAPDGTALATGGQAGAYLFRFSPPLP